MSWLESYKVTFFQAAVHAGLKNQVVKVETSRAGLPCIFVPGRSGLILTSVPTFQSGPFQGGLLSRSYPNSHASSGIFTKDALWPSVGVEVMMVVISPKKSLLFAFYEQKWALRFSPALWLLFSSSVRSQV